MLKRLVELFGVIRVSDPRAPRLLSPWAMITAIAIGSVAAAGSTGVAQSSPSVSALPADQGLGRIAFVAAPDSEPGNFEIYTMNRDGTGVTRLTVSPGRDALPAWSPDGSKIAFASLRQTPNCDGTDANPCISHIYVMNADGTGLAKLTSGSVYDESPAWSPDGSRIAFISNRSKSGTGPTWSAHVMNADGTGITRVFVQDGWGEHSVSWSPDGLRLAVTRCCQQSWEVWTMNVDGSSAQRLSTMTDSSIGDLDPRWSPDGNHILFWRVPYSTGGPWTVMSMNANGGDVLTIGEGWSPAWSSSGQEIVFMKALWNPSYNQQLFMMNADGSNIRQLTYNPLGVAGQASVQPDGTPGRMLSPAEGAQLAGSTVTFQWDAGIGVSEYHLYVGTSPGTYNIYEGSQGTNRSKTLAGLPTNGGTLFVRLWSKIGTSLQYRDYTYTTKNLLPAPAVITSPPGGSALTSASVTFEWDTGVGPTEYYLYVGTTFDGYDIYHGSQGTSQSRSVSVPANGQPVHVALWSRINGAYQVRRYTYTAFDGRASITSPSNGTTLPGSSATFDWNDGAATGYHLYVGSSHGSYDLWDRAYDTSIGRVDGLPTDGRTVYVRLWSFASRLLGYRDFSFVTPNAARTPAAMTSPPNGTTLPSSTVSFQWDAGVGASGYHLYIGSTPGGYDFYDRSQGMAQATTVTGLPVDGRALYVTLWTRIDGIFRIRSYTYTAADGRAAITSPYPGSTLPGRTATLSWSAGIGVSDYHLYVGTTLGGYDIYDRAQGTGQSAFVSGFPTNTKPVYVRLWSRINGAWTYRDFVFSAA